MAAWLITVVAQCFQAIALSAIALVGIWIAWEKLEHDRYAKRYPAYQVARVLLAEVIITGTVTAKALSDFITGTAEAPFQLDDSLNAYLTAIHDRAAKLYYIRATLAKLPEGDRSIAAVKEEEEHFNFLSEQMTVLIEKFRPLLRPKSLRQWLARLWRR